MTYANSTEAELAVFCVCFVWQEKQLEMSEELGKDQQSVAILQRKHVTFQSDLNALGQQVSITCSLILVKFMDDSSLGTW